MFSIICQWKGKVNFRWHLNRNLYLSISYYIDRIIWLDTFKLYKMKIPNPKSLLCQRQHKFVLTTCCKHVAEIVPLHITGFISVWKFSLNFLFFHRFFNIILFFFASTGPLTFLILNLETHIHYPKKNEIHFNWNTKTPIY